MKIAFAGTPDFAATILSAILRTPNSVCLVVTQPDRPVGRGGKLCAPPVKEFAVSRGLPVIQPESVNRPEAVEALRAAAPDALVVVAYGKILTRRVLALPGLGCFNVHASLLPKYRGAAPIAHAILNGERETGITIQRMAAGIDTGPVVMRKALAIGDEETAGELFERLSALGAEMMAPLLDGMKNGTLREQAQSEAEASPAPKLEKEDGVIPWHRDARSVCNFVRAMTPWPGAYTFRGKERLVVLAARTADTAENVPPGQVIRADTALVVSCGRGAVELVRVKPEGGKAMAAADFLRGRAVKPGELLHAR